MKIPERLAALRKLMRLHKLDAYIIPGTDPHQSEYPPEHWKVREWISGFTGSAGTVVVKEDKAGLWTDGRYFIQAARQLEGSGIDLFKERQPGVPEITTWLADEIAPEGRIGLDGRLFSAYTVEKWRKTLRRHPLEIETSLDLISPLWKERPPLPDDPIREHPVAYAGKTRSEKLEAVRSKIGEKNAGAYLITSLDDIAWLLNVRGNDIPYTPVIISYLLLTMDHAEWFLHTHRLKDDLLNSLEKDGVSVHSYDHISTNLAAISSRTKILFNPKRVNQTLAGTITDANRIEHPDPTSAMKAVKNSVETEQLKVTLTHDAAALVRLFHWIESELPQRQINESDVSSMAEAFRRQNKECEGPGFPTIAAYGDNAALMHYLPRKHADRELQAKGFLLVDSGGQYPGGTTDITRTLVLGELSEQQKRDFTLVLKGVINLSTTRFLKGSAGVHLDALARRPLWAHGRNYGCGTGHGIGYNLCVHEGPHGFSQSIRHDTPFEPGMVVTVEPGVYLEGRYGIRTENMLLVKSDISTEDGDFLCFETISHLYIDTRAIDITMLSAEEIAWLNDYHLQTYETLQSLLAGEERAWLRERTKPIG